jgi:hypothetical protein
MTSLPTTEGMPRTPFLNYQLHEFRAVVFLYLNYTAVTSRTFYHLQMAANASSFKTQVISYHKSVLQESTKLLHFFSEGNNK